MRKFIGKRRCQYFESWAEDSGACPWKPSSLGRRSSHSSIALFTCSNTDSLYILLVLFILIALNSPSSHMRYTVAKETRRKLVTSFGKRRVLSGRSVMASPFSKSSLILSILHNFCRQRLTSGSSLQDSLPSRHNN